MTLLLLADDPERELVFGTLVIAPGDVKRPTTPEQFKDIQASGVAKAVLNFSISMQATASGSSRRRRASTRRTRRRGGGLRGTGPSSDPAGLHPEDVAARDQAPGREPIALGRPSLDFFLASAAVTP